MGLYHDLHMPRLLNEAQYTPQSLKIKPRPENMYCILLTRPVLCWHTPPAEGDSDSDGAAQNSCQKSTPYGAPASLPDLVVEPTALTNASAPLRKKTSKKVTQRLSQSPPKHSQKPTPPHAQTHTQFCVRTNTHTPGTRGGETKKQNIKKEGALHKSMSCKCHETTAQGCLY